MCRAGQDATPASRSTNWCKSRPSPIQVEIGAPIQVECTKAIDLKSIAFVVEIR
jgi:hypothetical protein